MAAVRVFQSEDQFGSVVRTPGDQFLDAFRAFLQKSFHGGETAQTVSRAKSILQVQTDFIFVAQGCDWGRREDRVGDLIFFQYENSSGGGQFDGCAQAGNASSQDYKVGLGRKTLHKRAMVPLREQSSAASAYAIIEPHAASNNPRASAAVSGLD